MGSRMFRMFILSFAFLFIMDIPTYSGTVYDAGKIRPITGVLSNTVIVGSYSNLTGVGTLTRGVWHGSLIQPAYLDMIGILKITDSVYLGKDSNAVTASYTPISGSSSNLVGETSTVFGVLSTEDVLVRGKLQNYGAPDTNYPDYWANLPNMSTSIRETAGTFHDNKFYIVGGNRLVGTTNVYVYSGGLDWDKGPGYPIAIWGGESVSYLGRLHVIGGYSSIGGSKSNVYVYNADTKPPGWVAMSSVPVSATYHTLCVYDGYLYLIGGASSLIVPQSNFYRYDNSNWEKLTYLSFPIKGSAATTLGGKMYLLGGATNAVGTALSNVWSYNGSSWSSEPPHARRENLS